MRAGRINRRLPALAVLALLVLAALIYARHLGYPSGPIYAPVPATAQARPGMRGTVAVFFSGDMGFNTGMGPKIATRIAAQGVPVLGVNSLAAFARRRTPEEARALVRDAVTRALARPGARRVALIGQSFGADALLIDAQGLPADLRSRIAMVMLIVPARTLALQAVPGGLIELGDAGPSLPLAQRLDWAPALCIRGDAETDSLCTLWNAPNVRRIALPGGHFLNWDNSLVAATLMRALATDAPA